MFGISSYVKYSMLIGSSALLLFGVGYVLKGTTSLINEITNKITEEDENNHPHTIVPVEVLSGISDARIGLHNFENNFLGKS